MATVQGVPGESITRLQDGWTDAVLMNYKIWPAAQYDAANCTSLSCTFTIDLYSSCLVAVALAFSVTVCGCARVLNVPPPPFQNQADQLQVRARTSSGVVR